MKNNSFKKGFVLFLFIVSFFPLLGQVKDYLTLPREVRLNERQPQRGLGFATAAPSRFVATATWPQPVPELEEPALRQTFADLQDITRAVREVRATTGVPPKRPLTVTVKPPPDHAAAIRAQAHVVQHLAHVTTLTIDPAAKRTPGSANTVVGLCTVFVHDVVDDDAERQRVNQQLVRVAREIAKCERNLGNAQFINKAPPAVVEIEVFPSLWGSFGC